jgi:hypothetical protein
MRVILTLVVAVILLVLLALGFAGVRHATSVETVGHEASEEKFADVIARVGNTPMIVRTDAGWIRNGPVDPRGGKPTHLHILGYRSDESKIIRIDAPFWFLKMKGPALRLVLRQADFDMSELGITAGDLESHARDLVIDDARDDGDRWLVWVE